MRVVIVESTPSLRDALAQVLTEQGIEVAGTAADYADGLREVARLSPDVAVIDMHLPPHDTDKGLHTAQAIRARKPRVGLLVLSSHAESGYLHRLVSLPPSAGIGCILKERLGEPDHLVNALRRVHAGEIVIEPIVD